MTDNRRLVLLIDDDDDDVFFHRRAIVTSGFDCEIEVCGSGDTAMDYLTKKDEVAGQHTELKRPDLIFLDINMPRVDGWEFLNLYGQWIEKEQNVPPAIIVMLTTSVRTVDAERAKNIPIVKQYVSKPLVPAALSKIFTDLFPPLAD